MKITDILTPFFEIIFFLCIMSYLGLLYIIYENCLSDEEYETILKKKK
jgi:hypothetical protein